MVNMTFQLMPGVIGFWKGITNRKLMRKFLFTACSQTETNFPLAILRLSPILMLPERRVCGPAFVIVFEGGLVVAGNCGEASVH
jgi:hypothetical protein